MPDPTGEIEVYETFWKIENEVEKCAPPLLVYADLFINRRQKKSRNCTVHL